MANGWNGNGAPGQPMTAGQKAAATRRANRAAGIPPKTKTRTRARGPVVMPPKPTYRNLKLVALSAIEDLFVALCRDTGVTAEARKAFDQYQKVKALALGPISSEAMQNEANVALRTAIVNLSKLAF